VRALAEDKEGGLWIATAAAVSILEGEKLVSLESWREARGSGSQRDDQLKVGDTRSVFVDNAGRVWLATASEVLLIEKGSVQRPAIEAIRKVGGPRNGAIRAIGADLSGRVWFGADAGGVIVYDPVRRESQRVNFLDRDHVSAIFAGSDGNVWFATENGVISSDFYSFVSFTTSRGLADNDVQQVVVAPGVPGSRGRGGLWFLTLGGVSRLEGERMVPVEGFRTGISVRAVAFDREGSAWFAPTGRATLDRRP
jgi:ligand-binding sensor domain-containing protein